MSKQNDHDLIIEIKTQLVDLTRQVRELKEGTLARIASLEKEKADRYELEVLQDKVNKDIEIRVRALENTENTDSGISKGRMAALMVLSFAVASVLIPLVSAYISRK